MERRSEGLSTVGKTADFDYLRVGDHCSSQRFLLIFFRVFVFLLSGFYQAHWVAVFR